MTTSERKAKERQRKKEKGLIRREYWATPKQHEQLKKALDQIKKPLAN